MLPLAFSRPGWLHNCWKRRIYYPPVCGHCSTWAVDLLGREAFSADGRRHPAGDWGWIPAQHWRQFPGQNWRRVDFRRFVFLGHAHDCRRNGPGTDCPLRFAMGQYVICGVLSLLTGTFIEHPSRADMLYVLPAVLYTAVFSIALGFTLQVIAQKHAPPNDAP